MWSKRKEMHKPKSAQCCRATMYITLIGVLMSLAIYFMPQFPPVELETELEIFVLLYKRPENARLLLADLNRADYAGHSVPLHLIVDKDPQHSPENSEVVRIAQEFEWKYGKKFVDIKSKHEDVRDIWLSLGHSCVNSSMFAVFEDDIRLSPQWFQWSVKVKQKYFDGMQENSSSVRTPVGFSLTPIRVVEMRYPYVSWDSNRKVPLNQSVYMHNLPSSWAPVFYCPEWKKYLEYAKKRTNPMFMNLNDTDAPMHGGPLGDPNFDLPGCHSNIWNNSWKRLLLEYCFFLGKTTLYPNFLGRAGYASNMHMAGGAHVNSKASIDARTNSLIVDDSIQTDHYPDIQKLAVFDVHGYKTSHVTLQEAGKNLLQGLLKLGGPYREVITTLPLPPASTSAAEGRFFMTCPVGDMYKHLLLQALGLGAAKTVYSGLLLPHLFVGHVKEFVPHTEVFELTHKINSTSVKVATVDNLRALNPQLAVHLSKQENKQKIADCIRLYSKKWNADNAIKIRPVENQNALKKGTLQEASRVVILHESILDHFSPPPAEQLRKALQAIMKLSIRSRILFETFIASKKINEKSICIQLPKDTGCLYKSGSCVGSVANIKAVIQKSEARKIVLVDSGNFDEVKRDIPGYNAMWKIVSSADVMRYLKRKAPAFSSGVLHATTRAFMIHACLETANIYVIPGSEAGSLLTALIDNKNKTKHIIKLK